MCVCVCVCGGGSSQLPLNEDALAIHSFVSCQSIKSSGPRRTDPVLCFCHAGEELLEIKDPDASAPFVKNMALCARGGAFLPGLNI